MNNHVEARIAAITAAIERRRMEQECPEDDLSRSLREFGEELAVLDEQDKAALLHELNHGDPLEGTMGLDLSMQDLDRMIEEMKV